MSTRPIATATAAFAAAFCALLPSPAGAVWDSATKTYARASLPAVLEAENFDRYYDTGSGNAGGEYRATGVDIKLASEYCGTYAVGWMRTGEWLEYDVSVASAGSYDFAVRVASAETTGAFHLEVDRVNLTGPIKVPFTGEWNTEWTTVTKTVTLSAGAHTLRIQVDAQYLDLNYFSLTPTGAAGAVSDASGSSNSAGQSSGTGSREQSTGPITIEAEDFDRYHDTGSRNLLGEYRSTGVDIKTASGSEGGYAVGVMQTGEWLEYDVQVPAAGSYEFAARVASAETGKGFHMEVDRTNVTGFMIVPYTGAWNTGWATITKTVTLPAGAHSLRIYVDVQYMDLNYFRLTPLTTTTSAAP